MDLTFLHHLTRAALELDPNNDAVKENIRVRLLMILFLSDCRTCFALLFCNCYL